MDGGVNNKNRFYFREVIEPTLLTQFTHNKSLNCFFLGVGLVVPEVGIQITIVHISEDEDHSLSSRLEDVMESRPLMHDTM